MQSMFIILWLYVHMIFIICSYCWPKIHSQYKRYYNSCAHQPCPTFAFFETHMQETQACHQECNRVWASSSLKGAHAFCAGPKSKCWVYDPSRRPQTGILMRCLSNFLDFPWFEPISLKITILILTCKILKRIFFKEHHTKFIMSNGIETIMIWKTPLHYL